MTKHRPLCLITAVFNVSLYLYIFYNELPNYYESSKGSRKLTGVNATHPFAVIAPQSIAQTKIKVYIWKEYCPRPIVRVRFVGPEIHVFPPFALDPNDSSSNDVHTLEVDIQNLSLLVGVYKVEANVIQCHSEVGNTVLVTRITNDRIFSCTTESDWNNILNIGSHDSNATNDWIWVNSPKCKSQQLDGIGKRSPDCASESGSSYCNQADYVFMEINRETKTPLYDNLVTLKDGITTLSKPTSLTTTDESASVLKYFSELSNYELVCWMGDDDARRYFRAFMDLYPLMGSRGQRPFKFKYITLRDTSDPTKDFSDAAQMTYDKCKIFFVSYGIDRFDAGISPESYGKEVETLLGHIERSHKDVTYPTWFLSPRSSTSISGSKGSCVEDSGFRGRTPDRIHKFNERIRRIFHDRQLAAPESEPRIRLMDNSDITEAFWHVLTAKEDASSDTQVMDTQIAAAVAMRCMEKISQQVKSWRSMNQIGTQNGLMKDGTLIPNSELYKEPYQWRK
mmetsp:Transcript_13640/g.29513  ORF Transcript_13640/g.29513 Transcript_13640/m.29513 type:complete len:509 (+) Transcript_13640:139-1665(+)